MRHWFVVGIIICNRRRGIIIFAIVAGVRRMRSGAPAFALDEERSLFYSTSLSHRCYQLARLETDNKNEGR